MADPKNRRTMLGALRERNEVRNFLKDPVPDQKTDGEAQMAKGPRVEKPVISPRIAVTVRLPEPIVHALIDACAGRRKRRQYPWSQQDILADSLKEWLEVHQGDQ